MSHSNRSAAGARCAVAPLAGVLALVLAVALPACTVPAGPSSASANTRQADTTVVTATPRSIVVFDHGTLDTLQALGVDSVAGIAKAGLPPYLASYADETRYPRVGTLFEPDEAAVRALTPDLIIVGRRAAGKLDAMQQIATAIDLSVPPGDLAQGVAANARRLAAIVQKEDVAEPLARHLEDSARTLRERMKGQGAALVVLTVGGKIIALPPGPRFGAIYETVGLPPLALGWKEGERGKPVTPDLLREHNPDWLFVIDRDMAIGKDGATPARELIERDSFRQSKAWQQNHVVYLDPVDWYILDAGGLTSLQRGLDAISAALDRSPR